MWASGRVCVGVICAIAVVACSHAATAPDFTLRDDAGTAWTLSAQRGKAVLLTFGFTHCRDTCPVTLAKLSRSVASLHERSHDVEIAFVTIDPARDTAPVMHRYLERFPRPGGGSLVGLTGAPAQIGRVKKAYGIWSQPIPHDIAHTAAIVLIGPDGRIAGVRNDDVPAASLARAVAATLPSS